MADETETVGNQFAVVATGFISPLYEAVPFRTDDGTVCPVIVRLCRDRAEAERYRKRLLSRHSKVDAFNAPNWIPTTPILGIVETDLPAAAKRPGNPNAFGRGPKAETIELAVPAPTKKGRK